MRQGNVQSHVGGAGIMGAPVGCFHDARAATSAHIEAIDGILLLAVLGNQSCELACQIVVACIAHGAFGQCDA